MAQYGIFFTQIGRDKIASATEGNPLDITHIAVGDGGGGYPEIDDSITSLVNELGRYPINGTSTPAPTQRQFSAVVPPDIGPAVIRERGLIDSDGDLIAIAQAEPIEMPAPGPNAVSVTVGILATFNNADYVRAIVDLQGFVKANRKIISLEDTGVGGGGELSDDVEIFMLPGAIPRTAKLLTSEDDLNQLTSDDDIGYYYYGAVSIPKNAPFNGQALVEIYKGSFDFIKMVLQAIDWDGEFHRHYQPSLGWSDWREVQFKEPGKGLSTNDFTDELKVKLEYLEGTHWRGVFPSKAALESGVSNPVAGDYADVDAGAGHDAERYIWDASDNKWVVQSSATSITAAQVKQMYESNPDTNAFTDAEKTKLAGIEDGANKTTVVQVTGDSTTSVMSQKAVTDALEEAGTDWKEDIATEEEARNPTIDDKVMTPKKVFRTIDRWSPERAWGAYVTRNWTSRQAAEIIYWKSVTWSPELGLFVAVGANGTNRVMTSPDGINWIGRQAAEQNSWQSVTWSPELGLFVAVAKSGINRVMTSPDGINWIGRQAAEQNSWQSVTWSPELGLFVAVADRVSSSGTNRVMTSPDGINWAARQAAENNDWKSVTWSPELGLFVAVGADGTNRVMTSPDGINWIGRQAAEQNSWQSVTWSPELGLFVAVAATGSSDRVMTSTDGINWTGRQAAEQSSWSSTTWSPELGLFVAVASTGENRVMASPDGINWTARQLTVQDVWSSTTWSPELGLFVAVGRELVMHTL